MLAPIATTVIWNLLSYVSSRMSVALIAWLMIKPAQADNLLSYLPFNGNLSDISGNHHDATLWGNANFIHGSIGQALSFNGYLELQDSETMPIGDHDYTVSLWMKSDNIADNTPLVSKGGQHCETGLMIAISNHSLQMIHAFNGWCMSVYEASVTINDGIWHFIASVVSPLREAQLYVDGRSVCNASLPSSLSFSNSKPIKLGGNEMLPLGVDELRIYGRSLNQSEIRSLYQTENPAEQPKNSKSSRNSMIAGVSIAAVTGLGLFAIKRCCDQQPEYQQHEDARSELQM